MEEKEIKNKYLWYILGGITIIVLVVVIFIINLKPSGPVCNSPYILVGNSCCLDYNSNNICDNDERTEQIIDTNNEAEIINQVVDFLRSCLSNCPKECVSCGILSIECVKSCDSTSSSKIENKGYTISSEEEAISLMNDKNQIWMACFESCYDVASEYVDYDCVHNC